MSANVMPVELEALRHKLRRARVFYQIFPVLTFQPSDAVVDWFEIALHAEVQLREQPGQDAVAVLTEVAELLIGQPAIEGACGRSLSSWYYTAHPQPLGEAPSEIRLFRSLSLVMSNVPPYRKHDEAPLLAVMRGQLEALGIPRIVVPLPVPAVQAAG